MKTIFSIFLLTTLFYQDTTVKIRSLDPTYTITEKKENFSVDSVVEHFIDSVAYFTKLYSNTNNPLVKNVLEKKDYYKNILHLAFDQSAENLSINIALQSHLPIGSLTPADSIEIKRSQDVITSLIKTNEYSFISTESSSLDVCTRETLVAEQNKILSCMGSTRKLRTDFFNATNAQKLWYDAALASFAFDNSLYLIGNQDWDLWQLTKSVAPFFPPTDPFCKLLNNFRSRITFAKTVNKMKDSGLNNSLIVIGIAHEATLITCVQQSGIHANFYNTLDKEYSLLVSK
jgi:hypothetical protein